MKLMILDDSLQFCNTLTVFMNEFDFISRITIANDFNEFKEKFFTEQPDIVFMDIQMPDISGFEVLKAVKLQKPSQRVIMVSMYSDPLYIEYAMQHGATGYVQKTNVVNVLGDVIKKVANGETYFFN